jgi:ADP-ribose pyrophosphatase YjhB (NUDIX family)
MIDDTWYSKPEDIRSSLSTGGVVARVDAGTVLVALVREADFDKRIIPKGRVEPGESLEQAARREIAEEAGLTGLTYLAELGVTERLNYSKDKWKVITYYLYITEQVEGKPTDLIHNYLCEWFPLDALPEMFWPEQRRLLEENREKIINIVMKFISKPITVQQPCTG